MERKRETQKTVDVLLGVLVPTAPPDNSLRARLKYENRNSRERETLTLDGTHVAGFRLKIYFFLFFFFLGKYFWFAVLVLQLDA